MTTSVALCTYNGALFLKEQLDSILGQSQTVDEIVVCDDGSTDTTFEILQKYKEKYPNIFKIYLNENNLGYVKNFEKAISLCTQDLIFICDQDDVWHTNKVKEVVGVFTKNPHIDVLAHRINLLLPDESMVNKSFWDRPHFDSGFDNQSIVRYLMLKGNVFAGMSMVITQKAIAEYLPFFFQRYVQCHDIEIVIKSCACNRFYIHDSILASYRIHEGQSIGIDYEKNENDIMIRGVRWQLDVYNAVKNVAKQQGVSKVVAKSYKKEYQMFFEILKKMSLKQKIISIVRYHTVIVCRLLNLQP